MDLDKARLDTGKTTYGVWVELDGETSLRIAQWLNPHHARYVQKLLDPYKRAINMGTLDDETSERLEVDALAETVLLDWKGLKEGGKELPYSKQTAVRLLSDPSLSWLLSFVKQQAQDTANFRKEVEDKEVEDVGKPLSGNFIGVGTGTDS